MEATESRSYDVSDAVLFAWSIVMALLVVVVIEGILWTLSRIFVLNFDVAGPNATIMLFVLLATGWVLAERAFFSREARRIYVGDAAAMGVGFFVSLAGSATVAGLGAVLMVTAATPILAGLVDALRERVVVGVALGLLLATALRVFLKTASPYATTLGTVLFATITLAGVALVAGLAYRDAMPTTEWGAVGAAPATLGSLLIVAAGYLAHPQAIARWSLRSYELSVVALVVGVGLGLVVLHVWRVPDGPELVGWGLAFLVAVAVLLYVPQTAAIGAFVVAWASALVLLAAGVRETTDGSGAVPTAGFQFLAVFTLFLTVSATHWAFLPFPFSATKELGTELTLLFHAIFPLSVAYVVARTGDSARPSVDQSRRSAMTAAGAGVLPLAGLAATLPDPGGETRDGDGVRVMTFNIHLYLEEHASGQYSLEEIRDVIAEDGADIVSMPESDAIRPLPGYVDGVRWLGDELGYYTAFGAGARLRSYGAGIISRWPIENVEVVELPIGLSLTRVAITATVQPPDREPIPVVSTHFMVGEDKTDEEDTRDDQSQRILELASEDRSVVLGDFNIEPDEPEYEILTEELTDAWLAADERSGVPETYSPADPQGRIDYVFLGDAWAVREATTIAEPDASDHMAIAAEIDTGE